MPDRERGIEITITFNDRPFIYRHNEMTAVDVRDCRRETGFTVNRLLGLVGDADIDIDSVAAILWLARRQQGERGLRYDAVASTVRPDSRLALDVFIPTMAEEADDDEDSVTNPE